MRNERALAGIRLVSDKRAEAPVPQRSCSRNQGYDMPIESGAQVANLMIVITASQVFRPDRFTFSFNFC
jgi:hypothetical protein